MAKTIVRYSKSIVVIHWASAIAVLGAWLSAEGGRKIVQDPPLLHFTLGLAVLVLVLPRLILRLIGPEPEPVARTGWLALGAKIGHGALYLLLIGLPLTGWYVASQMGVQVSFAGLPLPALTAPVQGRPGLIAELHENAGNLILILAGAHALMAIWHQFVLHDGALRRMSWR
jgi:cytochrome b561